MVIDEDYILEHFGKKGMHWGVRKERTSGDKSSSKKSKQKLTPEQVQKRVEIGITVLTGALFVGKIIANQHASNQRTARGVRAFQDRASRNAEANRIVGLAGQRGVRSQESAKWLRQNKFMKDTASSVRTPPGAARKVGGMSSSTKNFLADFAKNQNKIIQDANGDLRAMDNKLQIPFAAREYLQEWV